MSAPVTAGVAPLDAAAQYLALGWSVIPLEPRGKRPPVVDSTTGARMGWEPYQTRRTRSDEVERWLLRWPDANVGVVAGAVSGLIVADFDGPEGAELLATLDIPPTPTARTGNGWHVFFKHPGGDVRNFARKMPGLDLRGDGGYVVAPPSIHATGAVYTWEVSPDTPLAAPPAWLLDLIRPPAPVAAPTMTPAPTPGRNGHDAYAAKALAEELERVRDAREGCRNDTLNKAAFALGQLVAGGALDRGHVETNLLAAAQACGLGEHEARPTIRSGLDDGAEEPRSTPTRATHTYHHAAPIPPADVDAQAVELRSTDPTPGNFQLDDIGNGERLVARHGHRLRYVNLLGGWLVYDGRRWLRCGKDVAPIRAMGKETARSLYTEAAACKDAEQARCVAKFAHASASRTQVEAMLWAASSEPAVQAAPCDFDADPMLLNCRNGILDLRTGTLQPHNPSAMLTRLAGCAYDPHATAPRWLAFLARVFAGNQDMIDYMQRCAGYSLTGDTSEQSLFVLHGTGANGKSTFLGVLHELIGEYGQVTDFSTFLVKHQDVIRNDLAALAGVRFTSAIEASEGARLAENVIKQMTGGELIRARFLFAEGFEYKPQFKVWLAANHKPVIRGTDHAIWRRPKLIPFTVTIPDNEKDPHLPEKLRAELPGILNWALQGCLGWQRSGLDTPAEVVAATATYRAESDVIGQFLAECCLELEGATTLASALYAEYRVWCKDAGEPELSGTAFGRRMTERGFERRRDARGTSYQGIGLIRKEPE